MPIRLRTRRTASTALQLAVLEALEPRQLLTAFTPLAPTTSPTWLTGYFAPTGTVDLQAAAALAPDTSAGEAAALPRSVQVNAAGLPLLESRAGGQGLPVFIDMSRNDGTYGPFNLDSDNTTYNLTEELAIYKFWRKVVGFFSQFNVNVTDVAPGTGSSDPNFAWIQLTPDFSGGAAYVNSLTKSGPTGHDNQGDVLSRVSGTVHELGHILGLGHQSNWDQFGNLTAEYSNGDGYRNVPIMGIDYNGSPTSRFTYGRADWNTGPNGAAGYQIQDDVQWIANTILGQMGGDGFRPDDFGNTVASAYTLPAGAQQLDGYIERMNDADVYKITSTGGPWNITATPLFGSQLRPNLELLDANGNVIASRNDADYRNGPTNEEFLNINLAAGTYYVRVTSNGDYDSLGYYQFGATQLPANFASSEVGIPTVDGSVTYNSSTGVFTQGGGGSDIWGTSDQFRYTYQTLSGDGSITARIDSLDNIGTYTKAGIMIRQSLDANSAHGYIGLLPDGRVETIWRSTAGASATNVTGITTGGPWVRITRTGNLLSYLTSADGNTWNLLGTTTISMSGSVFIGLATCAWDSSNPTNEAFATYSNVTTTGNTTPTPPTYNLLSAPANLVASPASTATTSINLSWSAVTGATGYVIERSINGVDFSTLATVGSGVTAFTDANVWGSMRWFYRVSAANGTSLNSAPSAVASTINKPNAPTLPSYTAPVIRYTNSLDINFLDVQGETGYRLEISSDGGTTYSLVANLASNETSRNILGLTSATAYKIRLTPFNASGDGPSLVFDGVTRLAAVTNLHFTGRTSSSNAMAWDAQSAATGYYIDRSTDGTTWGNVATLGTVTTWTDTNVTPGTEYYYRVFAFNASDTGPQSNVIFDATPAATLPSGWTDADIGTVAGTGAGVSANGTAWTLVSSGSDIAGSADSFHFTYKAITTDATVIARIDSLENNNNAAKAGIMIRQDLTAGSKFVGMFMNAGGGYGIDLRRRTTANTNYTYQQLLASVTAPYWFKLTRSGSSILTYYSADGTTWTAGPTISISLTGTFYVGLAGTAFSTTALNTATFSGVGVGTTAPTVATPASASPNPVTGTTTTLNVLGADNGGEATLTYTWSTTGTPPAAVSFSSNGTNAAKSTTATFSKAGSYTFSVLIQNGSGLSVTSTVVVTVSQTLSGIVATSSTMAANTAQQISFADQFGQPMTLPGSVTVNSWSTTNGSISSSGLLRAPATGSATVGVVTSAGSFNTSVTFAPALAWYKADQSSGTTLTDSSGNNKTASLTGSYAWSTGFLGNALHTTGGYATLPTGIVSALTSFTIATWVKADSISNWARIFDFGSGTATNMFLTPSNGADGTLRFALKLNNGTEQQINTTYTFPTSTWVHVAVTETGSLGILYINGTEVGRNSTLTLSPSSLGSTNLNYLGKSQYADPAFQGSIDDFRIFSTGLSASAIAGLYTTTQHTPSVTTSATAASTNITTGTSTTLVALGNTPSGNAALTYTWTVVSLPNGANTPTFSVNGSNAAQNTTVTFHLPGTYILRVTIADPQGLTITSDTPTITYNPLLGDANADGNVDLADYDIWYKNVGGTNPNGPANGDFNFDNNIDLADYDVWYKHVGATAPLVTAPSATPSATYSSSTATALAPTATASAPSTAPTTVATTPVAPSTTLLASSATPEPSRPLDLHLNLHAATSTPPLTRRPRFPFLSSLLNRWI